MAAGLTTAAMTAGLVPGQARAAEDRPAITWTACAGDGFPAGTRCGTLDVPLDWAHPDGRTTTLRLARLPATDPVRRIGSVLHIPGGPGSSGIEDVKRAAGDLAGLRKRFDLVAYDPRNTGLTATLPESCAQPAVPALTEPRNRAEYDAQARTIAAAIRECRAEDRSGLYGRLDSLSVARDMEAIRAAIGERRLSFMANSYGGVPAAAYLRLFPEHVRAMYLDGVINQTAGWANQSLLGYQGLEREFQSFTTWCAATPACALHGEDAGKVWRDLTARADRSPIPVTSQRFGRGELTGSSLRWFGFAPDPGPGDFRWLTFAEAVDKARHGDGSGFADASLGNARGWAMPLMLGMTCADDRGLPRVRGVRQGAPRGTEDLPELRRRGPRRARLLGVAAAGREPVPSPAGPRPAAAARRGDLGRLRVDRQSGPAGSRLGHDPVRETRPRSLSVRQPVRDRARHAVSHGPDVAPARHRLPSRRLTGLPGLSGRGLRTVVAEAAGQVTRTPVHPYTCDTRRS
ncbi:alpha/beta fold hydrolase [Microbispora catharanthi]|uniref:Alpha/beta fold hydrolase n=1 Tax=Microbispora catharanthi TaxID=1712871 RepID=A0A5N6BMF6_9ACTN|nr:alpha/beta fold hydrolase [Microbispora catharanthi]KAB8181662.1 alpha/beta fold hydrolase [Microbispora catharanthi]